MLFETLYEISHMEILAVTIVTSGCLNHWTKKPTADFRHPPYGTPYYIY
jgi:hypothetical protein